MLGWINISICSFICDTFGVDKWEQVVAAAGVTPNWASSCPYSDKITYDLVVTAAGLLGVSVADALEAYGLYFVQHVEDQGYNRLLKVLGSNLAEFLQNLNDLHLHLQYCWPDMMAPAFRCEQVTPESLLLHYFSNRPGLWPIVVGVLKGMSKDYFKLELKVELVHSREQGDCDHEVFKLSYPYQPALQQYGEVPSAAQASFFSLPAPLFYQLHPFHLIMDSKLRLMQWGAAVGRVVPDLKQGAPLHEVFRVRTGSHKCKVPSYIQLEYSQILVNTNSSFVLQSRSSGVTLKGQMLPTTTHLPGSDPGSAPSPVLLFLASPWMRSLSDMQASGVFLSDIPRHDLSSDYILLAEQRQAEADLKDKYERLTLELKAANEKLARTSAWLEEEKARAEALLYRMSGLIACFPAGPPPAAADRKQQQQQQSSGAAALAAMTATLDGSSTPGQQQQGYTSTLSGTISVGRQSMALDRIEAVRRELAAHNITSGEGQSIQCLELLGEGAYGKVYKGLWKGTIVAVKTIVLPAIMSGQEKREKMAIMEAAISSALSHPNIMQTYTYDIKPIKDTSRHEQKLLLIGSTTSSAGVAGDTGGSGTGTTDGQADNIHSYEVRLVCEYCDKGSLREALDLGAFKLSDGGVNYPAVLDTAVEITAAVAHLHHRNVLHSDLKARNIMLKSSGGAGRGVTAKVADFGLAVKMDHMETHLSNAFQGTMTHMAPEILIKGHISKSADVYALGVVLWELYTAQRAFKGIPRALLGHQITQLNRRPEFPRGAPEEYVKLAQQCWDPQPSKRPTLEVVLDELQALRAKLRCPTEPLAAYDIETHILQRTTSVSKAPPASATKQQRHQQPPRRAHSNLTAAAAAAAATTTTPARTGTGTGPMSQQPLSSGATVSPSAPIRSLSDPVRSLGLLSSPRQQQQQQIGTSPSGPSSSSNHLAAAGLQLGASVGTSHQLGALDLNQAEAEGDYGQGGSSRYSSPAGSSRHSFYLEHSLSTAEDDGPWQQWQQDPDAAHGHELSFTQADDQPPPGAAAAAAAAAEQQQQLEFRPGPLRPPSAGAAAASGSCPFAAAAGTTTAAAAAAADDSGSVCVTDTRQPVFLGWGGQSNQQQQ